MAFLWLIFHLVVFLFSLVATGVPYQTICNKKPYGMPNPGDCLTLTRSFVNKQDDELRIFDEEQLAVTRGNSWPGIVNPFKSRVVQVPRYWSKRKFNRYLLRGISERHC